VGSSRGPKKVVGALALSDYAGIFLNLKVTCSGKNKDGLVPFLWYFFTLTKFHSVKLRFGDLSKHLLSQSFMHGFVKKLFVFAKDFYFQSKFLLMCPIGAGKKFPGQYTNGMRFLWHGCSQNSGFESSWSEYWTNTKNMIHCVVDGLYFWWKS